MIESTISTGSAAKLCAVTRDTILKWIKKGLIDATRTPGGHYRVLEESIKPYLASSGRKTERSRSRISTPPTTDATPCWEYMSPNNGVNDACQNCIVYRSKALRCFEMSALGDKSGFQGTYCDTSCDECSYYQQAAGQQNHNVLVITEDEYVIGSLIKGLHNTPLMVRFTSSVYECSTLIDSFKPGILLVDFDLQQVAVENLCQRLADDQRLPGAKIVAITSSRVSPEALSLCRRSICANLEKPVSLKQLESCIQTLEGKLAN